VFVKNGIVWREEQQGQYGRSGDSPDYGPRGCQKGLRHSKYMYGKQRVLYPMKRIGKRGEGRWQRIGWDQAMAEIAAATLAGDVAAYAPRPDTAALKVSGIAVWSAGEIAPADAEAVTLTDEEAGHYRRLWLREGRLVGAVLYGDTADAPFYLDLIVRSRPVAPFRANLAFGARFAEAA
jgi:anaerobic selenocysteine-containing dehydrogenase